MNKSELLENYTAEQLAEMVIALNNASKMKYEASEDGNALKIKCGKCGEEFIILLDNEHVLCTKAELFATREANKQLNRDVTKLQYEVGKYRKSFEDAKKERDCQIAEYQKKIEDLEHDLKTAGEKIQDLADENMKLQCERNNYKSKSELLEVEEMRVKINEIADFLPTEPIKVADMLISATYTRKKGNMEMAMCRAFGNNTDMAVQSVYSVSELRQIAEHLLVYCNANGEDGNEEP